ncbi:gamma-glutamylcyclotransferase family protein [Pyrodictium abyssi]|uniref:gamma-glutamylcyclotransferase family protein n=1 Tax=Pyrodictium abyssi TaxID=54256 RepID=UPI0030C75687
MIELLFVYGSLHRRGSAHRLMRGARLLGPALLRGYTLAVLEGYPAALPCRPQACCVVEGELYAVPAWLLPELDRYEGPLYERRMLTVEHGGGTARAWVYVARARAAWGPLMARWRGTERGKRPGEVLLGYSRR